MSRPHSYFGIMKTRYVKVKTSLVTFWKNTKFAGNSETSGKEISQKFLRSEKLSI